MRQEEKGGVCEVHEGADVHNNVSGDVGRLTRALLKAEARVTN